MEKISNSNTNYEPIELPPGFRFHPTDEELITHYLSHKVLDNTFTAKAIAEVDLNKVEPWDLPWRAKMGETEWYFFCARERKYPTGSRTNRASEGGYWKATGMDKEIFRAKLLVGMKKTLVFYRGRAPRGEKTNWVMHEYRLEGKNRIHNLPKTATNEWVICRIFKKTSGGKKVHISGIMRSDSQKSDLPRSMDLSSDKNHTRTSSAKSLLSNAVENYSDKVFDEFIASSKKCEFSPLRMPDQSILRHLLDDNASSTTRNDEGEVSQCTSYDEVKFKPCEEQEFPSISTAPIDLDCLWDY